MALNKLTWRFVFLGTIILAVGQEFYALFDGNDSTEPLTTIILRYIPADWFFVGLGGLFLWMCWHFGKYYFQKDMKK